MCRRGNGFRTGIASLQHDGQLLTSRPLLNFADKIGDIAFSERWKGGGHELRRDDPVLERTTPMSSQLANRRSAGRPWHVWIQASPDRGRSNTMSGSGTSFDTQPVTIEAHSGLRHVAGLQQRWHISDHVAVGMGPSGVDVASEHNGVSGRAIR